ncbi:hypothetical protein JJB99_28200 [Bradyrhizobium diazoefficiens]|uniref:hypothetical protein n=1 Tax=Bradyrhizobium diazoefficiens TaxID=1355477 RepID=UPI00190B3DCE|nr:hypothetical protein [Bradyrhizobium diazoefficiens]QQO13258.1 hypothetical protein JJB99_28200 [Bradyrhizobium diazoefficiens]
MRLVDEINGLLGLKPGNDETASADGLKLCARLSAAGYALRSPLDAAEFADRRREHARRVQAVAAHLGTPTAPLLP